MKVKYSSSYKEIIMSLFVGDPMIYVKIKTFYIFQTKKKKLKECVSGIPELKYKGKRDPQEGSRDAWRNKEKWKEKYVAKCG